MNDEFVIEQKQGLGNSGTQIGVQKNIESHPTIYVGPSLEEITRLITNLFLDNFPRMQEIAREAAEQRVKELWKATTSKLILSGTNDFSPFMETDVQYVLYEAQKNYARFPTEDLLSKLSSLIAERIRYNNSDMCLKVTIDQAISIIGMLSSSQLDFLSLLFLTTKVKFGDIHNLEQLKNRLEFLDATFSKSQASNWQHLNMLGCLQLDLPDVCKINADNYNFDVSDVDSICPLNIKNICGDYSVSPIGTIIAIIHTEQKTAFRFDPKIWIHD